MTRTPSFANYLGHPSLGYEVREQQQLAFMSRIVIVKNHIKSDVTMLHKRLDPVMR